MTSIDSMGLLMHDMGQLEEARPLYEEALQARRETLGDRHPSTLSSIKNMGQLLKDMGQLKEAKPLLREALQDVNMATWVRMMASRGTRRGTSSSSSS